MALPPVLPSQDNSSWHPTMLGPVGFAAPPLPHAPTAATDPERAALISVLEELRADRKEMREELAEARAEISRLRDQSAEIRKDMDNARWGNSWGSAGWWNKDYTGWRDT